MGSPASFAAAVVTGLLLASFVLEPIQALVLVLLRAGTDFAQSRDSTRQSSRVSLVQVAEGVARGHGKCAHDVAVADRRSSCSTVAPGGRQFRWQDVSTSTGSRAPENSSTSDVVAAVPRPMLPARNSRGNQIRSQSEFRQRRRGTGANRGQFSRASQALVPYSTDFPQPTHETVDAIRACENDPVVFVQSRKCGVHFAPVLYLAGRFRWWEASPVVRPSSTQRNAASSA